MYLFQDLFQAVNFIESFDAASALGYHFFVDLFIAEPEGKRLDPGGLIADERQQVMFYIKALDVAHRLEAGFFKGLAEFAAEHADVSDRYVFKRCLQVARGHDSLAVWFILAAGNLGDCLVYADACRGVVS